MIVAVEGIDGAGKSTLAQALATKLGEITPEVRLLTLQTCSPAIAKYVSE